MLSGTPAGCKGWQWIVGLLQSPPARLGYATPELTLKGHPLEAKGFLGGGRGVNVYRVAHEGQNMVRMCRNAYAGIGHFDCWLECVAHN